MARKDWEIKSLSVPIIRRQDCLRRMEMEVQRLLIY